MWKYFKEEEIKGLNTNLVAMLDQAREHAEIPFIIASGLRTVSKNEEVGGVTDSSHLQGLAVDIACNNSTTRMKIITGLFFAGFNRIGITPDHIHTDIDKDKKQFVIFLES